MDEISKYGITFRRLNTDTLEMVRQWRNSDDVRLFMQYQKIISPEEQQAWFEKINNDSNYYYVAYANGEPYGLYNVKDINRSENAGEAGVFVKSRDYWEGDISLRGSFLLAHVCFEHLKLDALTAHVLKDNKKVLSYNKQLGFRIDESFEDETSYRLVMTKESFYTGRIMKLIKYMENQDGKF